MADVCNSCGAEIQFEAGKQSLTCPFCGSVNRVERPEDALATSFEHIIPMAVTPQELDARVYAYMASGQFTPDDMLEAATITLRERSYVPAFAFNVEYEATWTASFGFNRQEPYTAYRTVHRNNRSHQEAYTAYRTVTDWRPANGVEAGIFDVAAYAGTRLAGDPLAPADLVVQTVLDGNATVFNPAFIQGHEVESFTLPEKKVFDALDEEINANIDQRVKDHAQGDKQRDWHWNARMSHSSTAYAVPICHVAFQYGEKEYKVWIGGHDVEAIRADALPVDKDKKKAADIGLVPGVIGLLTTGGSAYFWGFTASSLVATAVAFGYGFLRRKALVDYSKAIRNSLLTQMQASNQVLADLSEEEQARVSKAFQRPDRPFFARIHKDKVVLPALAACAFLGAVVPNAVLSPTAVKQRAVTRYASEQAEQARRNAELRVTQAAAERQMAQEQASQRAQEAAEAALQAEAQSAAQEEAEVAAQLPSQEQEVIPDPSNSLPATTAAADAPTEAALVVQTGFTVMAPEESKQLLTMMLQQATSAFKVSEIKGQIETLPKPVAGDRKTARKLNEQGLAALRSDDVTQAVFTLANASATDPADVEVRNNYVYALIKAMRIQDAESEAGRLLTISPGRSSAWANLAEVYVLKNKPEAAVAALVLAFQFSSNKDRTIHFLNERAADPDSPLQASSQKAIEVIQRM